MWNTKTDPLSDNSEAHCALPKYKPVTEMIQTEDVTFSFFLLLNKKKMATKFQFIKCVSPSCLNSEK